MSINDIIYGIIDAEGIDINPGETARRLLTERGYTTPEIEDCKKRIKKTAECKYSCVRVNINFLGSGELDLGFGKFKSEDLCKNLKGCSEAFIFASTLGIGIDRLLQKLSLTSPSTLFIADGIASALAESVCDETELQIKGNLLCNPRFSPGYGDLPLEIQPHILRILNAQKLLGVTIGKQLLMTPTKTITAIMGIKNEN